MIVRSVSVLLVQVRLLPGIWVLQGQHAGRHRKPVRRFLIWTSSISNKEQERKSQCVHHSSSQSVVWQAEQLFTPVSSELSPFEVRGHRIQWLQEVYGPSDVQVTCCVSLMTTKGFFLYGNEMGLNPVLANALEDQAFYWWLRTTNELKTKN
jgi:hypothetical protein